MPNQPKTVTEQAQKLSPDQKLVDSDLNVSLDVFDFEHSEAGELEVVEDNDEIDLAMLARASEDAPVVRLVNVLLVDSQTRRVRHSRRTV